MTEITKVWKKNCEGGFEIVKCYNDLRMTEDELIGMAASDVAASLIFNRDYGVLKVNKLPNFYAEITQSLTWILENIIKKDTLLTLSFTKKNGDERIITGYSTGESDSFGRLYFIDLEKDEDDSVRLVDTREIRWVISGGTKYTSNSRTR